MAFHLIDLESWPRKETYMHFTTIANSTNSLTVNMDITKLMLFVREHNYRLYPTFTWIISRAINGHMQFKMGLNEHGELGYYDTIYPDYAVLNEQTENMDSLCTAYSNQFHPFYSQMVSDMEAWKQQGIYPDRHANAFVVSCVPWIHYATFTSINESGNMFFFPMVTWGKYVEQDGKTSMPLTLQIHHAVADGYHCSLFYNDVEEVLDNPAKFLGHD